MYKWNHVLYDVENMANVFMISIQKSLFFFCQFDQEYSGAHCNIKHKCNCANDSSIRICSLHTFGSYCHLKHSICQSSNSPCQHNGLYLPTDDRINSTGSTCFCSKDCYSGERCQNNNNRIDVGLDATIISINSLVFIHFITAFEDAEYERITLLKTIPFHKKKF